MQKKRPRKIIDNFHEHVKQYRNFQIQTKQKKKNAKEFSESRKCCALSKQNQKNIYLQKQNI